MLPDDLKKSKTKNLTTWFVPLFFKSESYLRSCRGRTGMLTCDMGCQKGAGPWAEFGLKASPIPALDIW